jgi:dipeptidyl aminopeptidase/acylaminoacyl peptidase
MRSILGVLGISLLVAAGDSGGATPGAGMPPIIDRQLIFGNPEISQAEISPDGHYIAFLKPWHDTRNIYVKTVDEPFSAARLLTTETKRPIPGYMWSWDGKYILYVKDHDGDENFNAYAVDPAAKPAEGAEAPPSRDLTGLKGVRVVLYDRPKSDPDILYIGLNDRDKKWHDLYKLRISTGEKTLLATNTERIVGWTFDLQGRLRLGVRSAENGDYEVLRVDPNGFTKIYSCSVLETCYPARFQKDGKRVYMATNKGADVNLVSLTLFDPDTGSIEKVESDPLQRVDLSGAAFSEVTDELLMTVYYDTRARRYFRDKAFEADYHWLQKRLPNMEVGIGSRSADEQKWLVTAFADSEPGETFLFDRKTRTLMPQYRIHQQIPRDALSTMTPVEYPSKDGLLIPAYLTLPKGVPEKNLPTIILPHGGPTARYHWGYDGLVQFLANRGYAVLQPNFRGSSGYGKKFVDAGNLEWGAKMQDDITWGAKYLVARGIADPKRIGIMGGSYGGYATLAGVAFTPDVYAAAVDEYGPSNLITLWASMPPYWEGAKRTLAARIGDPATADGKALLMQRSPLNSADRIKTPLLIVQGANDPRVTPREAEQIVIALRDRGFPVEYYLAPDEGHGFARPINNLALRMAEEKFLAEHLGGRYQAGGTPEEVARLKELTVDPKTVVLTSKAAH